MYMNQIHICFPVHSTEVSAPWFNLLFEPAVNPWPEIITVGDTAFCSASLLSFGWNVPIIVKVCWVFIFQVFIFINAKDIFVLWCKSSLSMSWSIKLKKPKLEPYKDHVVDEIALLKCTCLRSLLVPYARVHHKLLSRAPFFSYDAISDLSDIKQCEWNKVEYKLTCLLVKGISYIWCNPFGLGGPLCLMDKLAENVFHTMELRLCMHLSL